MTFDAEAFAGKIRARLDSYDLRLIDAAEQCGVSKSTIHRALKCQPINTANFLMLCRWLGLEPLSLLVSRETSTGNDGAGFADEIEGVPV